MTRRSFLAAQIAASSLAALPASADSRPGLRFADVTRAAGLDFHHHSGAFGAKYLPETLGPGCAFLDYDNDGWQDVLFIDGAPWPGHPSPTPYSCLRLYRNNRDG